MELGFLSLPPVTVCVSIRGESGRESMVPSRLWQVNAMHLHVILIRCLACISATVLEKKTNLGKMSHGEQKPLASGSK